MAILVITRWYFMISYDQIRTKNNPQLWEIQVEDPALHPMAKVPVNNCHFKHLQIIWVLMDSDGRLDFF